jgi:hypothetical protein
MAGYGLNRLKKAARIAVLLFFRPDFDFPL